MPHALWRKRLAFCIGVVLGLAAVPALLAQTEGQDAPATAIPDPTVTNTTGTPGTAAPSLLNELQGTVQLTFKPDGVRCSISAPLRPESARA